MRDKLERVIKEPLLHFLLLGAVIFATYSLLQKPGKGEPNLIVVTMGQVEHLAASFTKTWQRPPMPEELAGLVRDRVREEVYYREAIALGLDQDDTVIRRRLRQKMEFIADDVAAQAEPTDTELTDYLQANLDKFRVEPLFTFRQVYLNPERRGEKLAKDADQLLAQLNQAGSDADSAELGDASLLEPAFAAQPASVVARQFGEAFAAGLQVLTPGQWQGPIESGYGVHLVYLSERTEGGIPALADVRDAVRREWANTRRLKANEDFYQQLLQRYTVTIEGLESADQKTKLAANLMQ